MAARARTSLDESLGHQARGDASRVLATATEDHAAAPSPALTLQQTLATTMYLGEAACLGEAAQIRKWPPIATLAFVVVTCGAFWTAVALGVSRLL